MEKARKRDPHGDAVSFIFFLGGFLVLIKVGPREKNIMLFVGSLTSGSDICPYPKAPFLFH